MIAEEPIWEKTAVCMFEGESLSLDSIKNQKNAMCVKKGEKANTF